MARKYHQSTNYFFPAWVSFQVQAFIASFRPTVAALVFLFLFGYVQQCWLSSAPPKSCPAVGSFGVFVVAQQLPRQTIHLGVRSLEVTNHAAERMAERGVSLAEVRSAVQYAQLFAYVDNGLVKIGYYDVKSGLFLAVDQRHTKLITVIRKVNNGYPERLIRRG